MKTTTRSVTLGQLLKQQRRKARYRNSNAARKNISIISKYSQERGEHVVIYQDLHSLKLASETLAHRLGLPEGFVIDRMGYFHRIADYSSEFEEEQE